jgi:hypothetical protein
MRRNQEGPSVNIFPLDSALTLWSGALLERPPTVQLYLKPIYHTFEIVVHTEICHQYNSTAVYWCFSRGAVCPLTAVLPRFSSVDSKYGLN